MWCECSSRVHCTLYTAHNAVDSWSSEESAAAALFEQSTANQNTPKHEDTISKGRDEFPRDLGGSKGSVWTWGVAISLQDTKKHGACDKCNFQRVLESHIVRNFRWRQSHFKVITMSYTEDNLLDNFKEKFLLLFFNLVYILQACVVSS